MRNYIKQWRNDRELTQEELAERIGMSPPAISQLERGKQGFTGESLARIAEALDCTPAALLACDPSDADSLWPLFEAADSLPGERRQTLKAILQAYLARPR